MELQSYMEYWSMTQKKIQRERDVAKEICDIKLITKYKVHAAIQLHDDRSSLSQVTTQLDIM
jgi:hypothetical protein